MLFLYRKKFVGFFCFYSVDIWYFAVIICIIKNAAKNFCKSQTRHIN